MPVTSFAVRRQVHGVRGRGPGEVQTCHSVRGASCQGRAGGLRLLRADLPPLFLQDLQLYLSNLANQIDRDTGTGDVPLVILLDDLSEAGSISELVNGALTCKYHKW